MIPNLAAAVKRPKVRGLKVPRLATPRLGLSTKKRMSVNPFRGNRMTTGPRVKVASLSERYDYLRGEKAASADSVLSRLVSENEVSVAGGLRALLDKQASTVPKPGSMNKILGIGALGVGVGAAGYGATKGWQAGQLDAAKSLQGGFQPKTVF